MATIAQNLETLDTAISTMKTNLNLSADASLSDVVSATSGGGGTVDWTEYMNGSISGGNNASQGTNNGIAKILKKIPITITPTGTTLAYSFAGAKSLVEAPDINSSNVTTFEGIFYNCTALETIKQYDTSKVTSFYLALAPTKIKTFPSWDLSKGVNFNSMFSGCTLLENFPVCNISSATILTNMFANCTSLTNTSLDNILQTCITATSYTGTKTLSTLGITSYSSATIQALPHYSDFTTAGWSIG